MKKIAYYSLIGLSTLAALAYAEPQTAECTSNTSFSQNKCDVCYTDSYHAKEAPEGWSSTITDITIPWEHGTGDLDEIIYDKAQKVPTIQSALTVTTKPTKPEDLWKNHETLIWKPFDDHKEFVLKKGEKVGLYRLVQDATITVQGKKPTDTILITTPLSVGSFNAETNEETTPTIRNICVLGKFTIDQPVVTTPTETVKVPDVDVKTPAKTETTKAPDVAPEATDTAAAIEKSNETETVTKELNSAGIEPVVTATPDQTKAKTGPGIWILMLIAFAAASGYSAWRKQKR